MNHLLEVAIDLPSCHRAQEAHKSNSLIKIRKINIDMTVNTNINKYIDNHDLNWATYRTFKILLFFVLIYNL